MSWSRGSIIFSEFIDVLKTTVDDEEIRQKIYEKLIPVFEEADCDTLFELINDDSAFEDAFKEVNPEEYSMLMDSEDYSEVTDEWDDQDNIRF